MVVESSRTITTFSGRDGTEVGRDACKSDVVLISYHITLGDFTSAEFFVQNTFHLAVILDPTHNSCSVHSPHY